jgi:hypothetical protein
LYTISGLSTLTAVTIPIAELAGEFHDERNCFSKKYMGAIILYKSIAPAAVFIPLLIAYSSYMREWRIHMLLQKIAKPGSLPRTRSRNQSMERHVMAGAGASNRGAMYIQVNKTVLDDVQMHVKTLRRWNAVPMQLKCVLGFTLPIISVSLLFFATYLASDDPYEWYWSLSSGNPGTWFFAYNMLLFFGMCIYGFYLLYQTQHLQVYSVFGVRKEFLLGFGGVGGTLVAYALSSAIYAAKPDDDGAAAIGRLYLSMATMLFLVATMILWPAVRTFWHYPQARSGRATTAASTRLSQQLLSDFDLRALLCHDSSYALFVEHLQDEFSVENILFWKEVEDFRSVNGNTPTASKKKIRYEHSGAKRIYELFIAVDSVYEVSRLQVNKLIHLYTFSNLCLTLSALGSHPLGEHIEQGAEGTEASVSACARG